MCLALSICAAGINLVAAVRYRRARREYQCARDAYDRAVASREGLIVAQRGLIQALNRTTLQEPEQEKGLH